MNAIAKLILTVSFVVASGCGGGTSGTSPTDGNRFNKVISGTVTNATGAPQENVLVSIAKGEERTTTDEQGRFTLGVDLASTTAELRFRAGESVDRVVLSDLSPETSAIGLQVELGGATSLKSSYELAVQAIEGEGCTGLFEEAQVIRLAGSTPPVVLIQQSKLPENTVSCTARLRVTENGVVRAGVEFQLLFVALFASSDGTGQTIQPLEQGATDEAGTGSLSFTLTRENASGEFFVIETPLSLPEDDRVNVVVSLLNTEVQ